MPLRKERLKDSNKIQETICLEDGRYHLLYNNLNSNRTACRVVTSIAFLMLGYILTYILALKE